MKPLILIVTRACNLRCRYCDVEKQSISMNEKVARRATLLYFAWAKKSGQKKLLIRFFGGEPLMNFAVVKSVVAYAKKRAKRGKMEVGFDLTTNGMLIDDVVMDFFKKTPEMRVIISLDGDVKTQKLNRNMHDSKIDSYKNILAHKDRLVSLPNMTVNMVVMPNQVRNFYKNFLHNYHLGFRRFNFLPAYFTIWEKDELELLAFGFKKIIGFLRTHTDVSVKNKEIVSDIPFFNSGIVVDCSGDLFGNNMMLSHYFAHLRGFFFKGNVLKIHDESLLNFTRDPDIVSVMRDTSDPTLFYASLKVDRILSNFVKKVIR